MKALLAICMIVTASFVWAGEAPATNPPAVGVVKGEVLEAQSAANYTYLRLKTQSGEIWAAIINTPVKKGANVTIENAIVMNNFESKALKRTFPMIVFGNLAGAGAGAPSGTAMSAPPMSGSAMGSSMNGPAAGGHALGTAYATIPAKKLDVINEDVHVDKAKGANARTVAEVMTKGAEFKDKTVQVRGKVVKYNPGIMGKNWVHLRDGSGSAADESNDLLVTTMSETKVGDIVTAKGIVRTDKDFGAGYTYKTLIEEATLK